MGIWSKLKGLAKKDVGEAARDAARKTGELTDTYTPTLKKVPLAMWAGGAAVAGGVRRTAHKSVLALQAHNSLIFLLITIVLHFMNTLLRSGPIFGPSDWLFWMYILCLPVLAAFLFYRDSDEPFPVRNLLKFMVLGAIAYYIPVALTEGVNRGFINPTLDAMLYLCAPLWPVYIFLNPGESRFTRGLATVFFIGWTFVIIVLAFESHYGPQDIQANLISTDAVKTSFATVATSIKDVFSGIKKGAVDGTKGALNSSVNTATQQYYVGTVDQSQGAQTGVSITQVNVWLTRFDAGVDDISASATMKVKSYSDSITIKNSCYVNLSGATSYTQLQSTDVMGGVIPASMNVVLTGAFQDSYSLECTIKQSDYGNKVTSLATSGLLVFNSTFPFETWGYIPYNFIDKDMGISLRRANKEPARELGLPLLPIAKYTPGPVRVGMAADSQPFFFSQPSGVKLGIDAQVGQPQLPVFGLTLSNEWLGKGYLANIDFVDVYIPEPFMLNMDTCSPLGNGDKNQGKPGYEDVKTWITHDSNRWKENTQYHHYTITGLEIKPTETFTSFRCQLMLDPDSSYKVLGISGVGLYTFFVHANYTYTLLTRTAVSIIGDPAIVQAFNQAQQAASTAGLSLGQESPHDVGSVDQCAESSNTCYDDTNKCSCKYTQDTNKWTCAWDEGKFDTRVCWYLKADKTSVYRCGYYAGGTTPNCADVPIGVPINNVNSANECSDETSCKEIGASNVCTCAYTADNRAWQCRWTQGSGKKTCWYNIDQHTICVSTQLAGQEMPACQVRKQ